MAEIKSFNRGNGITELLIDDGKEEKNIRLERKKTKRTAWWFLAFVAWNLLVGVVYVSPSSNVSTALYAIYWAQAIAWCGVWIYANYFYKGKK